jgi:hypothetical protein
MTIDLKEPWTGIEDSTGEFKVAPTEDPEYGVSFALDLYPVSAGERVNRVSPSSDEIEEWLRGNSRLAVSSAKHAKVGALPATVVDVKLSSSATREHADCPDRCVDFLGFEQWDHANGILGNDVYRFYLADVRYSDSEHVFIVTIEGRDQDHLDSFGSRVESLLATVRVPAHAP